MVGLIISPLPQRWRLRHRGLGDLSHKAQLMRQSALLLAPTWCTWHQWTTYSFSPQIPPQKQNKHKNYPKEWTLTKDCLMVCLLSIRTILEHHYGKSNLRARGICVKNIELRKPTEIAGNRLPLDNLRNSYGSPLQANM